jgi:hypothetical protein
VTVNLAPIIDNLNNLTLGIYAGYGIKIAGLIVIGGIMALLNREVQQPLTLVQIGIAAPALITSYINATGIQGPARADQATMISIITEVRAEELGSKNSMRLAQGFLSDVLKGITQPLGTIINKFEKRDEADKPLPPVDEPPTQYPNTKADENKIGVFCTTPKGRFGPGPTKPLGSPCQVNTDSGLEVGKVTS